MEANEIKVGMEVMYYELRCTVIGVDDDMAWLRCDDFEGGRTTALAKHLTPLPATPLDDTTLSLDLLRLVRAGGCVWETVSKQYCSRPLPTNLNYDTKPTLPAAVAAAIAELDAKGGA